MRQVGFKTTVGWGGWRPGAGRKPGPNPRIRHAPRDAFGRNHPSHVTLKVRSDVPSLRIRKCVMELERRFATASERGDFRLVHYSIQSNHVHMIVEATGPEALGRGMKSLAARFARAVNRVFQRKGSVLVDRFHSRALKTPREVRNALRYVLLNTQKHAKKALNRLDPASSARWFDGWKGRRPELTGPLVAVAQAHTWLLTKGWRRHGLLQLESIPGG